MAGPADRRQPSARWASRPRPPVTCLALLCYHARRCMLSTTCAQCALFAPFYRAHQQIVSGRRATAVRASKMTDGGTKDGKGGNGADPAGKPPPAPVAPQQPDKAEEDGGRTSVPKPKPMHTKSRLPRVDSVPVALRDGDELGERMHRGLLLACCCVLP